MAGLLPSFYRYMESTRHLLLYRLDSMYPVPATLRMSRVETLSLIHCAPESVERFLDSSYFPSLKQIHYLSAGPSSADLHRRFHQKLDWVFPITTRPYDFYDRMVEGGWGRREHGLLEQYLVTPTMINGKIGFDLYLPMRGFVYGEWYVGQQMAYLHKKHCNGLGMNYPTRQEYITDICRIPPLLGTEAVLDSRWVYTKHHLLQTYEREVLNLPDATPFHSLGM